MLKSIDKMKNEESYNRKLARAKKRVRNIKKFYRHLRIYIIINLLLLLVKFRAFDFFTQRGIQDQAFLDWFNWNLIGTPVVWGIGLLIHAWYVFGLKSKPLSDIKPKFLKDWEERQIRKYMNER